MMKLKKNISKSLASNGIVVVIRAKIEAIKKGGEVKDKGSKERKKRKQKEEKSGRKKGRE